MNDKYLKALQAVQEFFKKQALKINNYGFGMQRMFGHIPLNVH